MPDVLAQQRAGVDLAGRGMRHHRADLRNAEANAADTLAEGIDGRYGVVVDRTRANIIRRLLLHPTALARSAWLSLRFGPANWWQLPVLVSTPSDIRCGAGGRLELGGRIYLGHPWCGTEDFSLPRANKVVIYIGRNSRLRTDGPVSLFYGARLFIGDAARLSIGCNTYLNAETSIHCSSRIDIGAGCCISWQVQILDTDLHTLLQANREPRLSAPIHIGNHVWIGSRATILKGVQIGDGAVIGSGAVVTKDVAPRTLVAGNPARVVREDVDWQ